MSYRKQAQMNVL